MLKLSLDSRLQPIKYILTSDNRLQPITDIVDFTVDHSPLVTTALHSINELGKQLLKAAGDGNAQEVRTLLTQGSPFTSDWVRLGTSPLHLAAQNNNLDVCEVLLRGGISKDARNKVDRTPLHLAAYEGHYQTAELLIKHGADVNCKDMLNMTPLHWAVQNGHTSMVELLVRNGAQTNLKNKFDLTPQDIAAQINKLEIVELLQAYEGDTQAATQNLLMQLETEGLDNDVVELQENSNSSNEVTNSVDPVIISLDEDHIASVENQQSLNDDSVIINLPNGNEVDEGDRQDSSKEPVIINLMNDVDDEIQQECEKDDEIPAIMGNKPTTNFKLIDGVIHSVNDDTNNSFSAAQLLHDHGITMIPNDTEETNILNTVMESGHSVVLTDVGKEVLNTVKQQEEKMPAQTAKPKKIITVTPEEFLSMTNGQFVKNTVAGKFKVKPTTKRIVMKKNRPGPFGNMIKVQTVINKSNNNKTELEYVMDQLVEARKTIEEYKTKLRKKEMEVERYKMQLKLLMDPS